MSISLKLAAGAVLWWMAFGQAEIFPKQEVKIVGPIDYGQTSAPVRYTGRPRFQAFAFNGRAGETIEVTIHAKSGDVRAYLANARLESMSAGSPRFSATIPAGSEPSTYYIVVTEARQHPAIFSVELERPSKAVTAPHP